MAGELLLILVALGAGALLGLAGVFALRGRRRKVVVHHELVTRQGPRVDAPPEPDPAPFAVAAPAAPPPPPVENDPVPSEWARRLVGAPGPGRVRGVCSGCGTSLSVSARRPLRVSCPACGRSSVLP